MASWRPAHSPPHSAVARRFRHNEPGSLYLKSHKIILLRKKVGSKSANQTSASGSGEIAEIRRVLRRLAGRPIDDRPRRHGAGPTADGARSGDGNPTARRHSVD